MEHFIEQIMPTVGDYLPALLGAVVILLVGWLVALVISFAVRKLLARTTIDNRLATWLGLDGGQVKFDIEGAVSKAVYYLIMLFVLIAFFQVLRLTIITEPINRLLNKIFEFVPNILGAGALLLVAWLIATAARFIISKVLSVTKLEDRLSRQAGLEESRQVPLSQTLPNVVYWLIFLLFLPAVLGALGMEGLLAPVQGMVDSLLGFLPNLLGAVIILLVGWFVARIVRQIVTGLLTAIGTDQLGARVGLASSGGPTLSSIAGTVVYTLVLIPAIIASLNALQIEPISRPATEMLTTLLKAVPAIFGAMIVLGVTYLIGRLVAGLVTNVLTGLGFNRILALIGLGSEPQGGQRTPAEVVGFLVLAALMLFATIEAVDLLGFVIVANLIANFLTFAGQIVMGGIIFGLGLYLANLARSVILSTAGAEAIWLSHAARLAIIVLTTAMGLRQMGIAPDIVNLTFGILLGAIAVSVALAFGLGSRDVAAREVEGWLSKLRKEPVIKVENPK
jgi:Mechanosensitive ion channel, conserved TM helix